MSVRARPGLFVQHLSNTDIEHCIGHRINLKGNEKENNYKKTKE